MYLHTLWWSFKVINLYFYIEGLCVGNFSRSYCSAYWKDLDYQNSKWAEHIHLRLVNLKIKGHPYKITLHVCLVSWRYQLKLIWSDNSLSPRLLSFRGDGKKKRLFEYQNSANQNLSKPLNYNSGNKKYNVGLNEKVVKTMNCIK